MEYFGFDKDKPKSILFASCAEAFQEFESVAKERNGLKCV